LTAAIIENFRKYSEDSYEFYTPIKDTDLILTWRLFADVNIVYPENSEVPALELQYVLSFDAISEKEYHSEYSPYDISKFIDQLLAKHRPRIDEALYMTSNQYEVKRDKDPNRRIFEFNIEFFLYFLRLPEKKLIEKGWYNMFDDKQAFKFDILKFHPRFPKTIIGIPDQLLDILAIKPGYPEWVEERIQSEAENEKNDPDYPSMRSEEAQEELDHFLRIKESAYFVFHSEKFRYFEFVNTRPKPISTFYQKVDISVLKKSIQKLGYVEERFTTEQKAIVFSPQNLIFFGRSGTGKTHACVHTLLARHVTANAINSKMMQKTTEASEKKSEFKSIFITASPLLAKDVKAQYETTLKKAELMNAKEEQVVLTEDMIFDSLHAVYVRSKDLPKTFLDEDIVYPLFLSHQEFVSILYSTMMQGSNDFRQLGQKVKMEVNDEGRRG
jgi:DNA replication protein DnaC